LQAHRRELGAVAGQNQLTPAEITAMEPAFGALGTVNP